MKKILLNISYNLHILFLWVLTTISSHSIYFLEILPHSISQDLSRYQTSMPSVLRRRSWTRYFRELEILQTSHFRGDSLSTDSVRLRLWTSREEIFLRRILSEKDFSMRNPGVELSMCHRHLRSHMVLSMYEESRSPERKNMVTSIGEHFRGHSI